MFKPIIKIYWTIYTGSTAEGEPLPLIMVIIEAGA